MAVASNAATCNLLCATGDATRTDVALSKGTESDVELSSGPEFRAMGSVDTRRAITRPRSGDGVELRLRGSAFG